MEDQHCPECGNEIYTPFKYCNACGWEKSEDEEQEESKEEEEEDKAAGKKAGKDKKSKKPLEPEETVKPLKLKCKCGATIKVKSSKRPLKIKCKECGRTGTLKTPAKVTEKDKAMAKEKDRDKIKAKVEDKTKKKDRARAHGEDELRRRPDRPSKSSKPSKSSRPKPPHMRRQAGRERPGKHTGTVKKKGKIGFDYADLDEEYCPDCGTRLGITGSCPNCGYRIRSHRRGDADSAIPPRRTPQYEPPSDAAVVKPRKGICSKCNSRSLRFYDDGSGRCSDCGRQFRWDGGVSRVQDEEYQCKSCGEFLEYVDDYESWYCYQCEEYK
jgi:DNA-directed RNA polymerase subunit RPC12/RpoP